MEIRHLLMVTGAAILLLFVYAVPPGWGIIPIMIASGALGYVASVADIHQEKCKK